MLMFDKKMPVPAAPARGAKPVGRRRVEARPTPSQEKTPQPQQEPLSLTMTVNPFALTDQQLGVEREAVLRWLLAHREDTEQRRAMMIVLDDLNAAREQRLNDRQTTQAAPSMPAIASTAIVTGNVDLSPVTAKLGRAYPFARTPTPAERAVLRSGPVFHYSSPTNLSGLSQPDGDVLVKPSRGTYRNLLTPGRPESAFFFQGRPSAAQQQLNLYGAGPLAQQAEIAVSGADLPQGTLIRPADRVVVVPGGYKGPGVAVAPGEQLSLPLPGRGGATAEPVPSTRPPGMAGMAAASVGLGLLAGYSQQRRIERERDTQGYAPAGAAAYTSFFDGLANFVADPSMRMLVSSESRFNFSMWRENVRRNAAATPIGGTFTIAWEIHEPPALGGESVYTGRDVPVEYKRVSETQWQASVPAGGRVIDGILYFGEDDGGRRVPRLDVILTASDHEAQCELNWDQCA